MHTMTSGVIYGLVIECGVKKSRCSFLYEVLDVKTQYKHNINTHTLK